MKKLVIAVLLFNSFSVYSSAESVNTSVTDDKIFKIPAHVFIFENLFFPGAGHVYNDHLKLAAFNFFTTISALGGYFGNASSHDSYNELPAYPTMHDVNLNSGQECFLANRQARHDKDFANSLLLMAVISYIDGFVESYYAANKGWGDDLNFSVGGGGMFSGIRTLAIVNEGSQIARGQDAQTGGGVTFAIRHGRLLEKDVIAHFGPHAIITYDMTYYLRLN
ncbi:MAG: hypothetical protein JXA66_06250, partial [Oligoflexia bacterium]|nr:hypothetical protein [Oligoflexia bacterium]